MEKKLRVGLQVAVAGAGTRTGPTKITVREAITKLIIVLTGIYNVPVGGATIKEDSILRLLKKIDITLGGTPRKSIGGNSQYDAAGRILRRLDQFFYGVTLAYTAPSAAEGANAFMAVVEIPFILSAHAFPGMAPEDREVSAYLPGLTGEDLELYIDWGVATDVSDTAGCALTSAQCEILVASDTDLTQRALDAVSRGERPFSVFLDEATQSIQLTAAASAAEAADLNRLGYEPFALLSCIDNGCVSDDVLNRISFKANVGDVLLDGSWEFYRSMLARRQGTQANPDAGWALADYDGAQDMSGALPLADPAYIGSWQALVDHDALDTDPASRMIVHHMAMRSLV